MISSFDPIQRKKTLQKICNELKIHAQNVAVVAVVAVVVVAVVVVVPVAVHVVVDIAPSFFRPWYSFRREDNLASKQTVKY